MTSQEMKLEHQEHTHTAEAIFLEAATEKRDSAADESRALTSSARHWKRALATPSTRPS